MVRLPKRALHLLLLALVGVTALALTGCAPTALPGQQAAPRSITVAGQGSVYVKPDLALVNLGIETFAATVAEATQQNNTRMAAIMAKLKELNIPEKDIQTSGFSINSYNQATPKAGPDGSSGAQYRVSNTVRVKVRQPEQIGAVLDGVIAAGVNQVYGVDFTVEDPAALQGQARAKAVEDARQRADELAKLANVTVGQVLTISEGSISGPVYAGAVYAMGRGAADAGTPMSPGEVQINYQVQVSYAIQ